MKHGDLLKLRWLRMEAINELQSEEYDLVVDLTSKYQDGETPQFTNEEVIALDQVYQRVRTTSLAHTSQFSRIPDLR